MHQPSAIETPLCGGAFEIGTANYRVGKPRLLASEIELALSPFVVWQSHWPVVL